MAAARGALEAAGHRVDDYHTSSADAKDFDAKEAAGILGRHFDATDRTILLSAGQGPGMARSYPTADPNNLQAALAKLASLLEDQAEAAGYEVRAAFGFGQRILEPCFTLLQFDHFHLDNEP